MKSQLFEVFDRIYIINLTARTDRRKEMINQLKKIGISPDDERLEFYAACRPEDPSQFPTIGAKGCFMSHLGILKDAMKRKLNRVAIFEDDLNFSNDFNVLFPSMIKHLRTYNWSIFYGGYQLKKNLESESQYGLIEIPSDTEIRTTHFVCFHSNAIAKSVAYLEALASRQAGDPNGGPMHVDGAYSWFRRSHPSFVTLAANPQLGYQRSSRTDIHDLGWKDKIPVIRNIVGSLRKLKIT